MEQRAIDAALAEQGECDELQRAWALVKAIVDLDIPHRRHGSVDVPPLNVLREHAMGELVELIAAESLCVDARIWGGEGLIEERDTEALYELADVACVLLHYCYRKGWTLEYLGIAMQEKLRLRFRLPPALQPD